MWTASELDRSFPESASEQDIVRRFVERTPSLTAEEQVALVTALAETSAGGSTRGRSSAGASPRSSATGRPREQRPTTPSSGAQRPGPASGAQRSTSSGQRSGSNPVAPRSGSGSSAQRPGTPGGTQRSGTQQSGSPTPASGQRSRSGMPDLRQLGQLSRQLVDGARQVLPVVQQFMPGPSPNPAPAPAGEPPAPARGGEPAAPLPTATDPPDAPVAEPAPPPRPLDTANPPGQPPPAQASAAPYALGGWPPSAAPYPYAYAPASMVSAGQLAAMLQGLHNGQIPMLPQAPFGFSPMPAAASPAPGTLDATALLSLMLSNPALQQGLLRAAVLGPRHAAVQLPLPALDSSRTSVMPIPMNAVMPLIASLASRSSAELAELAESEPAPEFESELESESESESEGAQEFLLTESGDFIVDPDDEARRADLIAHYFRCSAEALRNGLFGEAEQLQPMESTGSCTVKP